MWLVIHKIKTYLKTQTKQFVQVETIMRRWGLLVWHSKERPRLRMWSVSFEIVLSDQESSEDWALVLSEVWKPYATIPHSDCSAWNQCTGCWWACQLVSPPWKPVWLWPIHTEEQIPMSHLCTRGGLRGECARQTAVFPTWYSCSRYVSCTQPLSRRQISWATGSREATDSCKSKGQMIIYSLLFC